MGRKYQNTNGDPSKGPARKRKYGSNSDSLAKPHPGRRGLYGAPEDAMGYVPNPKFKQRPSGR